MFESDAEGLAVAKDDHPWPLRATPDICVKISIGKLRVCGFGVALLALESTKKENETAVQTTDLYKAALITNHAPNKKQKDRQRESRSGHRTAWVCASGDAQKYFHFFFFDIWSLCMDKGQSARV